MELIIGGVIFAVVGAGAVIYIKVRDRKDVTTDKSSPGSNRPNGPIQFPK
jgi:hypothetical protein